MGSRGTGGQGDECLSPDKDVYIPLLSERQSVRGRKGGLYITINSHLFKKNTDSNMKHKRKLKVLITISMLGTYLQKNGVSHCSSDAQGDWLKTKGGLRLVVKKKNTKENDCRRYVLLSTCPENLVGAQTSP